MWWTTGFVVSTVVGLAALDWAAFMMHALGYGMFQALDPGTVAPPDTALYARALLVGCLVDVAVTVAMLWLLLRTAARRWPGWTTALLAAAVAGVVAASTLLLVLGINPLDVTLG